MNAFDNMFDELKDDKLKDKIMSGIISLIPDNILSIFSLLKGENVEGSKQKEEINSNTQPQINEQKSFWGRIGDWFKEKAKNTVDWFCKKVSVDTLFQVVKNFLSKKIAFTALLLSVGSFFGAPSYLFDLCSNGFSYLSGKILENDYLLSFLGEKGSTLSNIGTYLLKGISNLCGITSKVLSGGGVVLDYFGLCVGLLVGSSSLIANLLLNKGDKILLNNENINTFLNTAVSLKKQRELLKSNLDDRGKQDLMDFSEKINAFSEALNVEFVERNIVPFLNDRKVNYLKDTVIAYTGIVKAILEYMAKYLKKKTDKTDVMRKSNSMPVLLKNEEKNQEKDDAILSLKHSNSCKKINNFSLPGSCS